MYNSCLSSNISKVLNGKSYYICGNRKYNKLSKLVYNSEFHASSQSSAIQY